MGFNRRWLGGAMAACLFTTSLGCLLPPGPAERLSFSAHKLNSATRFDRMDVALMLVATDERGAFAQRHRQWHRSVRIVDVDLEGMQMVSKGEAEILLAISWHRIDETIIRNSTVAQRWKQDGSDWLLQSELRASGSPGLFATRKPKNREHKKPARSSVSTDRQTLASEML